MRDLASQSDCKHSVGPSSIEMDLLTDKCNYFYTFLIWIISIQNILAGKPLHLHKMKGFVRTTILEESDLVIVLLVILF